MISIEAAMGMIILIQTGTGIVGNSLLLGLYICSLFRRHKLRPLEQIVNHLALANTLILFCGGIPQTMAAFGLQYFLDDVGCKLVFYCHRVAWGNSLSTTCLLGGFQALSINPTNARWIALKFKSPKYINSPCIISWIFHLLINIIVPMRITGQKNSRNITMKSNFRYCFRLFMDVIAESTWSVIFSFIDVICLGIMIWASGFMIFFLHRHKQQARYIHSTRQSSQMSPETRATKSILMLVSTFVLFYSFASALETCHYLFDDLHSRLVETGAFITSSFPTLSPFLLLKSDTHLSSLCSSC
nr:vomeronasal type-1 receptor 1-like [Microcebus murinus]